MNKIISYPIYDTFTSKRGITWCFKVYSDLTIEQWHTNYVRHSEGWKRGRDIFTKPTKECREYIKEKYGINFNRKEEK